MSAHIHTYTYIHTHKKDIHMNARKEVWNDGAAANARGVIVERGSFARLFRSTQSNYISHLECKDFVILTSCSTNTLPSPIPSAQHASEQFEVCAVHNGPLRSCRKIGGKAAVHQSRSTRARRNPSPRMIKVTVHEETKGQ